MKALNNPHLTLLIACVCLLSSCTDDVLVPEVSGTVNDLSVNSATARKKAPPVSMFSRDDRSYAFNYDEQGRLASIDATSNGTLLYQYIVHYQGDRFVRADLVENGQIMSSHRNFEFDKRGRIVAYDYVSFFFPEDFPDGLVQHSTVMYDKKGNVIGSNGVEFLTYDPHRNVVQWLDDTFTYNKKISNPLNNIPDLWLVFVEEFAFVQLILSPDMMTSKTVNNVMSSLTTTYTHEFNSAGQVISMVGVTNGAVTERYTFSY